MHNTIIFDHLFKTGHYVGLTLNHHNLIYFTSTIESIINIIPKPCRWMSYISLKKTWSDKRMFFILCILQANHLSLMTCTWIIWHNIQIFLWCGKILYVIRKYVSMLANYVKDYFHDMKQIYWTNILLCFCSQVHKNNIHAL
jgi:hypothetical protein